MSFISYRKTLLALTGICFASYVGCGGSGGGTANNNVSGSGGGGAAASGGSSGNGSGGGAADAGGGTGGIQLGDGGGSGGSGGVAGDAGCAKVTLTRSLVPANVLFVVDRSGSMNCNLPADGQSTADCDTHPAKKDPTKPSKWELTKPALQQAMTTLAAGGNVSVGVSMFPNEGTNCTPPATPNVTVKPLDAAWATSVNAFFDTVQPGGQTPLVGATIYGYNYMHTNSFTGNKFLVVLTDGFETCAPDQVQGFVESDPTTCGASSSACPVLHAAQVGIRTFVIGVPGSEDGRAVLSEMASVGDTARDPNCSHTTNPPQSPAAGSDVGDCHYDMTDPNVDFAKALSDALAKISGTVLSCEVDTPKPQAGGTVDLNKVSVEIDNTPVQSTGGSGTCDPNANGWQYNADKSKILLCGQACTDVKSGGSISVVVECASGKIF